MKKTSTLLLLTFLFTSFKHHSSDFVGKIVYSHTYSDTLGNDITEKLQPFFGKEQHYFTDGKNYKGYDENGNWRQLYNFHSNIYYFFGKDKTAQKVDVTTPSSQSITVTMLDKTEKILGHLCKSLKIETENTTTIYYYAPDIRIDPQVHARHNLGEWNKFLEATQGSLDLKSTITFKNVGYIMNSVATEITRLPLKPEDFAFPTGVALKN